MTKMIFVNLPVKDLAVTVRFYNALGFRQNPAFSDDAGACMVWSDTIYLMLLTHSKWQSFTNRPIAPESSSEVSIALNCASKADVDAMIAAGAAHGGMADINPVQDLGFMYGRDVLDPDGHIIGPFWMDPAAIPPNPVSAA